MQVSVLDTCSIQYSLAVVDEYMGILDSTRLEALSQKVRKKLISHLYNLRLIRLQSLCRNRSDYNHSSLDSAIDTAFENASTSYRIRWESRKVRLFHQKQSVPLSGRLSDTLRCFCRKLQWC